VDYFKKTDYVLEQLCFDYLGSRYQGRGIMTWKPDEGFHIEAFLEKPSVAPPKTIEFGKVGIIRQSNITSIRMRPQGFDWGLAPNVHLIDRHDVLWQNRLSINLSRVIFSDSGRISNKDSNWFGSALYQTKNQLELSDVVHSEVRINGQEVEWNKKTSGIWYEDEQNHKIVGRMIDDRHLKLHWRLTKSLWSKAHSWQWPEAAQDSLSMLFGEQVWLLQREVKRGAQTCIEIRKRREIDSLGSLSLFGEQCKLDKFYFVQLTDFLVRNQPHAIICRNIFNQTMEASRQQSWQASELLVSTILEAALRSIDQHPFQPGDKSWHIERSLKIFREKYFSREWKNYFKKAEETHRSLRHRNAHPDWLFNQGGALSEEERAKSLDDMIFLSRFYGYMILTLAGFKNLEPSFPKPLKDWKPLWMIQKLDANEVANRLTEFSIPREFGTLDDKTLALQKQLAEAKTAHDKIMIWRRFNNSQAEQQDKSAD